MTQYQIKYKIINNKNIYKSHNLTKFIVHSNQ